MGSPRRSRSRWGASTLPPPAKAPADGGDHDPPAGRYEPASEEEWEAIEKVSAESDNGELEIDVVDGGPASRKTRIPQSRGQLVSAYPHA